jgi:hypothetical protein
MRTSTILLALFSMLANGGCAMNFVPTDLESPTPYAAHWVKNGVTTEARRVDSWDCGAARTALAADHVAFSAEQLRREMRPDEHDNFGPRARLTKEWVVCMKSKGYRYTSQSPN